MTRDTAIRTERLNHYFGSGELRKQILFDIEEAFDVYIPQDDGSFKFRTLGEVLDGVEKLIAARQELA